MLSLLRIGSFHLTTAAALVLSFTGRATAQGLAEVNAHVTLHVLP